MLRKADLIRYNRMHATGSYADFCRNGLVREYIKSDQEWMTRPNERPFDWKDDYNQIFDD